MATHTTPLTPTFEGHIETTLDAVILFEACLSGHLSHVPRRPHDRERQDLIKSGNVFIYEEHASGIKRWTDGVSWSPSRILGNFLIYRELEGPFPPGEKKRALKKKKSSSNGVGKNTTPPYNSYGGVFSGANGHSAEAIAAAKDSERSLIGSLVDSYPFKEDGLVKKTISVTFQGVPHHLVSYYTVRDVQSGRFMTPSKHHALGTILPRPELLTNQNFRMTVDNVTMTTDGGILLSNGVYAPGNGAQGVVHRTMSMQDFHHPMPGFPEPAPALPFAFPQHVQARDAHGQHSHYAHGQHNHYAPAHAQLHQQHHTQQPPHGLPLPSPQHSFDSSGLSSAPSMAFAAPHEQDNYALGSPFAAPAPFVGHEFPRSMPNANAPPPAPRRHSAFETAPTSDFGAMPFGEVPDGCQMENGDSYDQPSSMYQPNWE